MHNFFGFSFELEAEEVSYSCSQSLSFAVRHTVTQVLRELFCRGYLTNFQKFKEFEIFTSCEFDYDIVICQKKSWTFLIFTFFLAIFSVPKFPALALCMLCICVDTWKISKCYLIKLNTLATVTGIIKHCAALLFIQKVCS